MYREIESELLRVVLLGFWGSVLAWMFGYPWHYGLAMGLLAGIILGRVL
jgi:hypothetical protein